MDVLKPLRLRNVRSVAVLALAGLAAGCSADVARFDDGFYTGSVPNSIPSQTAQAYPRSVDQTNTGSIDRSNLAMQGQAYATAADTYAAAPAASVQRGQLPPPSAASVASAPVYAAPQPTYAASAPVRSQPAYTPSAAAPEPAMTAAVDPNRGTPPTTLQAQAQRIAALPTTAPRRPATASAPVASASASRGAGSVTVASGDSLNAIARRSGVSADALRRANGLSSDNIRIGQTLVLPAGASAGTRVASLTPTMPAENTDRVTPKAAAVAPAEAPAATVAAASPKPYEALQASEKGGRLAAPETAAPAAAPVETAKVEAPAPAATPAAAEEVKSEVAAIAPKATGIGQFRWPVQGRVVSRFGDKVGSRRNDGLNISVPRGTPIKAAENGVVIYAGDGLKEFGNTVLVKHDNGLVTVYGHADTLDVKRGQQVKRGQEIGKTGMSGDTTVPVLHFEVRKDSAPVDPNKYLL
ncbi:hypothetical protein ASG48_15945 [Aurantimonas sp. Leaf443]|nr:hypothetical protein ASG48_15945 [Aurantimonas sp. Leaf443]